MKRWLLVLPLLLVSLVLGHAVSPEIAGKNNEHVETKSTSISSVLAVAVTVADLDKSVEFYSKVLDFEKISETEVMGEAYDRLLGIFGVRVRQARLRLGEEYLELMEFLTPRGRAIPADSRSNDLWFQHIAIIVRD